MSIKDEFEKDLYEFHPPLGTLREGAFFGAKWVANRFVEELNKPHIGREAAIRQLAKELS